MVQCCKYSPAICAYGRMGFCPWRALWFWDHVPQEGE